MYILSLYMMASTKPRFTNCVNAHKLCEHPLRSGGMPHSNSSRGVHYTPVQKWFYAQKRRIFSLSSGGLLHYENLRQVVYCTSS